MAELNKIYKNLKEDLQGFNKYKNYFLIKIDNKLMEMNKTIVDSYHRLVIEYSNLVIYIYKNNKKPRFKVPFKIIYGHFYNDDEMIQYKNVINNEIDNDIHLGHKEEIFKNELDQPIKYTNLKTIEKISKNLEEDYRIKSKVDDLYIKEDDNPLVNYEYDAEINKVTLNEKLRTEFNNEKNILTILV